jgi:ABC-type Fe3+ transport system substrate-binding protein
VGTVSAILDVAPHPNAAQVFMNWLLSEEGQTAIAGDAEYSSPLNVSNAIPIDTLSIWRGEQTPEEIQAIVDEFGQIFG